MTSLFRRWYNFIIHGSTNLLWHKHLYYWLTIFFILFKWHRSWYSSGPPPPPTDLTISNFRNGQLQVVWNVSSTLPVESTFSMTVVKNNSHSRQQSIVTYSGLRNTTALINVSHSFCDVFYLWVMATNNAGESDRSQVTMWIPPYLPSFSPLSLTHTLSKTANRVYVSVAIQVC